MRHISHFAAAMLLLSGSLHAAEGSSSFQLTNYSIFTMGDKVSGHVSACLAGQGNKPRILFGMSKAIDGDPRFAFLVVFRTGDADCKPSGCTGEITADGTVTRNKNVYSMGRFKLPLTLESTIDPKTKEVTGSKVVVGDVELPQKEPGVVIVDLTGDKPTYKLVKVQLPACKIDLADREYKTWPKAIDAAIAELKEKSKEVKSLAD